MLARALLVNCSGSIETHARSQSSFAGFELQYGIIFIKVPLPIIAPSFR